MVTFGAEKFLITPRRQLPIGGAKRIFCVFIRRLISARDLSPGTHLHAHFAGMAARTAYWIKQFFNVPFSFTAHANDIFVPRSFAIGLDQLVDAASAVITETDYAANYLRERFPASAAKIERVYNGIDVTNFARANFDAPIPLILSVGRLIEKKGFTDLIEACRLLRDSGREFRCEIIGDGPLQNDLHAQIVRTDLETRITLVWFAIAGENSRTSRRRASVRFAVREGRQPAARIICRP